MRDDEPTPLHVPISRRAFLSLPLLAAWPFGSPVSAPRPVALQQERRERKQQLLTHRRPSETSGLADAMVIKDGDIFFLTDPGGEVPFQESHGLGLYFHDCRYLNGYQSGSAGCLWPRWRRPQAAGSWLSSGSRI